VFWRAGFRQTIFDDTIKEHLLFACPQFFCDTRPVRMSNLQPLGRKPLVSFSATNRARLAGSKRHFQPPHTVTATAAQQGPSQMPAVTRKRSAATARRKRGGANKIRFVKGRVQLRVAGYSGTRYLSPSHLVRHIPAAKLRLAARQVLRKTEKTGGRRPGKGRKRRKKKASKKKKRRRRRRK
jgi:hypothetical protein